MANLTTAGAIFLAQAAINDSPTFFSSGVNAALGVGSGTADFAVSDTDVDGASKARKVATVTRANGVLTLNSTFATDEANFAWNNVGIFNNPTSGGTMLARKKESLGTKTNTQVWSLTVTATFTAA